MNELEIAREKARSYSALDIPRGEYLGALPNGRGEMNYYYKDNDEYRYDCDSVRRWRAEREKDRLKRKKTERQKALEAERRLYG